jgi:Na+/H+ antiporter NhaD/arsenite permease-like protein
LLTAVLIFAGTYLVIAIVRLPGFRVDRTGAAIVGASLMIAANVVTPAEAWAAIRHETIASLIGHST